MKKVIITGANGFVGSILIKTILLSKEFYPVGLVRKGSKTHLLPANADIQYIDYSNDQFEEIINEANIVIHLAALTKALDWNSFLEININLTKRLVDLCNKSSNVEQFIFISSQAASGPSLEGKPLKEKCKRKPISQYGKSKKIAEDYIMDSSSKPWTIIRPVSVYGPGDKDFLQLFKLIQKHLSFYTGQKEKHLNLIYVEDLANLIQATILNSKAYNEIFFASTKESNTLEELVSISGEILQKFTIPVIIPIGVLRILAFFSQLIGKLIGKIPILNSEKVKEFSEKYWLADYTKAASQLGFEAKTTLFNGVYKTCKWYKKEGWLE